MSDSTAPELFSIGDVAAATGLAPDTIRVWERRYGRPTPQRLPSGHRRYSAEDVRWLRQVAEALALGHRPSKVVATSASALAALLRSGQPLVEEASPALDWIRQYQREHFEGHLRQALAGRPVHEFLTDHLGPLLTTIGRAWASGSLEIRHEHFASQVIEDFLRRARHSREAASDGPRVLLATLPSEEHGLGLQMAALLCADTEVQTIILGRNTPAPEILRAATEGRVHAVIVSVSLASGGIATDRQLGALRQSLPEGVELIVGGGGRRGVRRGPRDVRYLDSWSELQRFLEGLSSVKAYSVTGKHSPGLEVS